MSSNSLHYMLRNMSAAGNFFRVNTTQNGVEFGLVYVLAQTKLNFGGETLFPTYYLNWTSESNSQQQVPNTLLNGLNLPNCPLEDLANVPQTYQQFVQENAENLINDSPEIFRTNDSVLISQIGGRSFPHINPHSPGYHPYKIDGDNPNPNIIY